MGQIIPQKAFQANYNLKKKYGSYANYKAAMQGSSSSAKPTSTSQPTQETALVETTAPTTETANTQPTTEQTNNTPEQPTSTPTENKAEYTLDDIVRVSETGSVGDNQPKSAYDMYMEEALAMYNQGVETNNKNAANQAASAGAQYREINRFANELNKANGRANTGYAGDTSIDAYNAYRNSVNQSYSEANSANNELYSYYLTKMTELQQAKDTKEIADREYNENKETRVLSEIYNLLDSDNALHYDGAIKGDTAQQILDYAARIYGGVDNIPESIIANLETQKGFSEWLDAYNAGNVEAYNSNYSKYEANEISTMLGASAGTEDGTVGAVAGDNFVITYNGNDYKLEVANHSLTDAEYNYLNKNLSSREGAMIKYNGKLYVRINANKGGGIMAVANRGNKSDGDLNRLIEDVG